MIIRITSLRLVSAPKLMLYQLSISAALLGLAALIMGNRLPSGLSIVAWSSLAYQTFWVASVTFVGWMWLMSRYRAAELAAFGFMTPLLGVFAGWAIMGDEISHFFALAVVMVAAGIVLVNRPPRPSGDDKPQAA